MKRQAIISVVFSIVSMVFLCHPRLSHSHPGGLDSNGCHHNRKTGDYHCHRSGGTNNKSGHTSSPSSSYYSREREKIGKPTPRTSNRNNDVQVVGITDGDTIKVMIEGQQVKIRLYGIDAPESGQASGTWRQPQGGERDFRARQPGHDYEGLPACFRRSQAPGGRPDGWGNCTQRNRPSTPVNTWEKHPFGTLGSEVRILSSRPLRAHQLG